VSDFALWHRSVTPAALGLSEESFPAAPPLGRLVDPPAGPVDVDSGDPMVEISHRRISTVNAYWGAGWTTACRGTWVRRGVASRLSAIADMLPADWGLHVFDGWRPLALQEELYQAAYHDPGLPPGFLSPPDHDPATPPPHLSGGTVDLTLSYKGVPLALGTPFDAFWDLATTTALDDTPGPDRAGRRWLVHLMRAEGFIVLHCEWWHFEFGTRRWAAITGQPARYRAVHGVERPGGST